MFIYWSMFLFPAWLAIQNTSRMRQRQLTWWLFIGLVFTVLIGLRFEVGGDWGSYLRRFNEVTVMSLSEALGHGDPGYKFLNWWMASWGWGIYGVNLIAGAIFTTGLTLFCRQQPKPWLAFAVAVPYLVVVVGMGYTRQGVAVGLFMWAITYLERENLKYYLALIVLAALFHKSAVLMIPLGLFLHSRGWFSRVIAVGAVAYGLWDLLLVDHQEALWRNYVEVQMQSEGAVIRVLMNLVPSLILLLYWRRWKESFPNFWFWFWIGIASIVSFALVGVASTAVDRVALYFIPIQVAVYSRLPYLASKRMRPNTIIMGIILGYAAVLFVWLNFASHSHYWIPYQSVIFQ